MQPQHLKVGAFRAPLVSSGLSLNSREVGLREGRASLGINCNSKEVVHQVEAVYSEPEISSNSKETILVVAQPSSEQRVSKVFHNRAVHLCSAL